jgi:hypothetical protein
MTNEEKLYFFGAQINILENKIFNLQTQVKALRKKRKRFKKNNMKEKRNAKDERPNIENRQMPIVHGNDKGGGS